MEFNFKKPTEEELAKAKENYRRWLLENPNNFSAWFPKIKDFRTDTVRIPRSVILSLPFDLSDAFFMDDPKNDENAIRSWIRDICRPAVDTFHELPVFMKNGCYSGKFYFNASCKIDDASEDNIYRHLMNIQTDSLMFDTGGNAEIILREYIKPSPAYEKCIYGGMPFRPEMRLFYDFSQNEFLYKVFYWDWDYCHEGICDRGSGQDKEVYESSYQTVFNDYERLSEKHMEDICNMLENTSIDSGIYSVDFILEEDCVWLIDMAIAEMSAYWDPNKIKK